MCFYFGELGFCSEGGGGWREWGKSREGFQLQVITIIWLIHVCGYMYRVLSVFLLCVWVDGGLMLERAVVV